MRLESRARSPVSWLKNSRVPERAMVPRFYEFEDSIGERFIIGVPKLEFKAGFTLQ